MGRALDLFPFAFVCCIFAQWHSYFALSTMVHVTMVNVTMVDVNMVDVTMVDNTINVTMANDTVVDVKHGRGHHV